MQAEGPTKKMLACCVLVLLGLGVSALPLSTADPSLVVQTSEGEVIGVFGKNGGRHFHGMFDPSFFIAVTTDGRNPFCEATSERKPISRTESP